MKALFCSLNLARFGRPAFRLGCPRLLPALFAGMFLFHSHSAVAALNFGRGAPTTVGCIRFSSSPDSVTVTGALTGPGIITGGLAIPANRIQYDVINCDVGTMHSWTVYYSPVIGPSIIGADTPLGYITSAGIIVPQGGVAYMTLFNAGYGVYNYNTGAPWLIDYEPDHITFTAVGPNPGLPPNDGVGFLKPTHYLPSFGIQFQPDLGNGLVPASAMDGTATFNGQVYGPVPGNSCLSILCSNIAVETCSSCAPVLFSATALDTCCSNAVLQYSLPSGTCFPVNTTTTVMVTASDQCGNVATNFFTVTVNQDPHCPPTNCISINASNIVAYTCNPCTPVAYNVTAVDNCCPGGVAPTLIFNPPPGTCFPQNSSNLVQVIAYDQCGNTNTTAFSVTVLPGPDCGNTNCISLNATNIVAYTCSPCTTVPFNVLAFDQCCTSGGLVLSYNPPTNTCFPRNSLSTVQITASDNCGNTATKFITVRVLQDPNCPPTNCISLYASNIVAYTCSNCTTVTYNAFAVDNCCTIAPPTLTFNPPETTCFPLNSTNTVLVTATDDCGNSATSSFTVSVLPGTNCGNTNCISLITSNIVAYTCSNCTTVAYNAFAVDTCCPIAAPTLTFNPPETTCFPLYSTNTVLVTATDPCGNSVTGSFTVTVLQGANCGPTNCLSLYAPSNIVVYTCSNCTTVPLNAVASDPCCTTSLPTIVYNPPATTCFARNTTTPVLVTAFDDCGNSATALSLVIVLPGPNCGGSTPLSITGSGTGSGGGPNYLSVYWPPTNGQLLQSSDLNQWTPIPGATNSPYVFPEQTPMKFYRLLYQ
jgi:hypothetical protein